MLMMSLGRAAQWQLYTVNKTTQAVLCQFKGSFVDFEEGAWVGEVLMKRDFGPMEELSHCDAASAEPLSNIV